MIQMIKGFFSAVTEYLRGFYRVALTLCLVGVLYCLYTFCQWSVEQYVVMRSRLEMWVKNVLVERRVLNHPLLVDEKGRELKGKDLDKDQLLQALYLCAKNEDELRLRLHSVRLSVGED